MDVLITDLRRAARGLIKTPGFAFAATLTLAIGLGANIAIFSLINGLLLRPLPFPDADRLVAITQQHPKGGRRAVSPAKFEFWDDHARRTFAGLAAYDDVGSGLNLSTGSTPEHVIASRVSAGFFSVLGVRPAAGRGFAPGEDRPGAPRTVVLGYGLWQRRFGGDHNVVGRSVTLDGQPCTVVGVAPAEFRLPANADIWTPLEVAPTDRAGILRVVGRLRGGQSMATAQAEMTQVWRQHIALDDEQGLNRGPVRVTSLQTALFGGLRPALTILFAAVGMVLLIACVNTANLQMARAAGRRQEIAVRAALGGRAWQVMRPLLLESVLVALAGGAMGLALAACTLRPLLALSPAGVSPVTALQLDARVFAFAAALSLLVGVLSALPVAMRMRHSDLHAELKLASGRVAAGPARTRTGRLLVVAEMGLAVALLVGAGLLVRGFLSLRSVNPGFDSSNVLTLKLALPPDRYADIRAFERFSAEVTDRVRALPGVEAVAFAGALPLETGGDMSFTIDGKYTGGGLTGAGVGVAQNRPVTAGFFRTLRIPLRRGRLFTDRDRLGAPPVAIINETAARRYWPGENPVGQRIFAGQPYSPELADKAAREVVGVVADVKEHGLDQEAPAILYVPSTQMPPPLWGLYVRLLPVSLVVRTAVDRPGLIASVERSIWAVDPAQAAASVVSMDQIVLASLGSERFNALLLGILAAMALVLAAVGISGVLSSLVRARWREFAVRMALGATRADVLALVLGHGVRLAAAGAVLGLAGGAALARILASQLPGVRATDWFVFAASPLALLLVAVVSAGVPAIAATRSNPNVVLRGE
jgi:putative ABC transport system permease protein